MTYDFEWQHYSAVLMPYVFRCMQFATIAGLVFFVGLVAGICTRIGMSSTTADDSPEE